MRLGSDRVADALTSGGPKVLLVFRLSHTSHPYSPGAAAAVVSMLPSARPLSSDADIKKDVGAADKENTGVVVRSERTRKNM
jgi:hypothetical protein